MRERNLRRMAGEFVVIVVGVLVALAVDDWRDYRKERRLEAHLLERLEGDLLVDAADLAVAELVLRRRSWIFSEIDAAVRTGRAPRPMPDAVARIADVDAKVRDARRTELVAAEPLWLDIVGDPLWSLYFTPEFDQADDAFQEMIVGGTLRTLRDPELRSAILAYYRTSRDMAANVMGLDDYNSEWIGLLLEQGIAKGDALSIDDLIEVVGQNSRMATHVRHGIERAAGQSEFLVRIAASQQELRARLEGRSTPGR
jgi:hypothetical protein